MLALHNKSLTRRNHLGLLDFLEGALCFGPGLLCTLADPRELALLVRILALQGLVFVHDILELLLDLADLGLELLMGSLLLDNLPLGFGQGLFKGLDLGRRFYTYRDTSVNACHFTSFQYITGYHIPCFSWSCLLTWPSSCSACSSLCFSPETSAVCEAAASSDACVFISDKFS